MRCILNRIDNITKMSAILDDKTKFQYISGLSFDDTHKLEIKLLKQFLELFKKKKISREAYELIRPLGSQNRESIVHLNLITLCDLFCPRAIPFSISLAK